MNNRQYLIVGGTTKAATTSIFFYLRDHPQICPASLKEVRFFLPPEYGLSAKSFFDGSNLDSYEEYFTAWMAGQVRMDVTPDYLYSAHAAQMLKQSLPDSKIVFILRDPVDRLYSWFRFSKQNGQLSSRLTFAGYVGLQRNQSRSGCSPLSEPHHMRALEHGRYLKYLDPYYELFADQLLILRYEDLTHSPREQMKSICSFVGIDGGYFNNYEFKIYNKTQTMRFPGVHKKYIEICRNLRFFVSETPRVHDILRRLKRSVEPAYLRMNVEKKMIGEHIEKETKEFLENYYKEEIRFLAKLNQV